MTGGSAIVIEAQDLAAARLCRQDPYTVAGLFAEVNVHYWQSDTYEQLAKTAVVSGVGPVDGLGAQLCVRFANAGSHVLVAGRTQSKLDAVAELTRDQGGSAEAVVADATDEATARRTVRPGGRQCIADL